MQQTSRLPGAITNYMVMRGRLVLMILSERENLTVSLDSLFTDMHLRLLHADQYGLPPPETLGRQFKF